jgi:hypothetical protein
MHPETLRFRMIVRGHARPNARMGFMPTPAASRTVHLTPFASVADGAVRSLDVQIERTHSQTLRVRYLLHADLSRLRIPQPKPARRADELWKHTCFEAFLRAAAGAGYQEINVAPSSEWAVYSFDDYRKGMAPANLPRPPAILVDRTADRLTVDVRIDLKVLPPSRALALAAVLEDESGSLSYWALRHAATKPDFHHPDGFTLEI